MNPYLLIAMVVAVLGLDVYGWRHLRNKKIAVRVPLPGFIFGQAALHEAKRGWEEGTGQRPIKKP